MLCCGFCCGNMSKRDYKVATTDGIELEPLGGEKIDKEKDKDKEKQTNGVTFALSRRGTTNKVHADKRWENNENYGITKRFEEISQIPGIAKIEILHIDIIETATMRLARSKILMFAKSLEEELDIKEVLEVDL
ncbi:unnamed protein product [Ceratitis capitata]|uniref:(Mediterranean fruit fly) hypothetical protein n=1 Tax=Ceratitis capitata TaxID=7213 RepID=A0A811UAF7_CERCA|nr:unnamed protein product [Ceratitis capitata]